MKLWDASKGTQGHSRPLEAVCSRGGHPGAKVRALAAHPWSGRLASACSDGTLRWWDANTGLVPIGHRVLDGVSELTCAAAAHDVAGGPHGACVAVGSLSLVTLLDGRTPHGPVATCSVPDSRAGVRSLSLRGHALTVGCADGKLCFLDLRTNTLLPVRSKSNIALPVGHGRFYTSRREAEDAVAALDLDLKQAVFAHAWGPDGRLATGGGPLLTGTRGCYLGVWG